MDSQTTLYHGSDRIIEKPFFGGGRANNDYGRGFYCTESLELAKEWACSSLTGGYANQYYLDTYGMRILRLNSPDYTILNWITVLVNHRLFRSGTPVSGRAKKYLTENFDINVNAYDVIIGYHANDSYFNFAEAFLNNGITVEQLAEAVQLGKLGEQVVLKSEFAFRRLEFVKAFPAEGEVYYPMRKDRNAVAEKKFQSMEARVEDGLFMADIMREKVKNDDPRIPRNLSEQRDA